MYPARPIQRSQMHVDCGGSTALPLEFGAVFTHRRAGERTVFVRTVPGAKGVKHLSVGPARVR